MRDVTEYDGYKIETPYIGKNLTEEELKELRIKQKEAKEKAYAILEELKKKDAGDSENGKR